MIIYKATNKINGKAYIGQTIRSLNHRKARHVYISNSKRGVMYFHKALKKYGVHSFKWEVIHTCSNINDLNRLETFYIGFYDTFKNGYNLNTGGSNPFCSEETRKKIAKANTGKYPTEESRKKMSLAQSGEKHRMFGKHHAEDTIEKMKKIKGVNHPMCGYRHTEEVKKAMSKRLKGNKNALGYHHTENARKRIGEASKGNQYSTRSVIIKNKYFGSLQKSADFIGVTPKVIRYRIQHKTKWQDYSYA